MKKLILIIVLIATIVVSLRIIHSASDYASDLREQRQARVDIELR